MELTRPDSKLGPSHVRRDRLLAARLLPDNPVQDRIKRRSQYCAGHSCSGQGRRTHGSRCFDGAIARIQLHKNM